MSLSSLVLACALAGAQAFAPRASPPRSPIRLYAGTQLVDPKGFEIVDVEYSLRFKDGTPLEDGLLFDTGRVEFLLNGGNYIAGVHDAAARLDPEKEIEMTVSPERAFGRRIPELVATVSVSGGRPTAWNEAGQRFTWAPAAAAPDGTQVGDILMLQTGQKVRVTSLTASEISLDGNARFSGKDVVVQMKMLNRKKFSDSDIEILDVAGGCFWGLELAFQRVPGVVGTAVGYTQGEAAHPTYEQVCTGSTGHAEAVRIFYNSMVVTPEKLLEIFFENHNPSQLNRQGNDVGTQYRGGIYYRDPEQKQAAKLVMARMKDKYAPQEIVTERLPAADFWYAEDYHQQYLQKGGQSAKKNAEEKIRCYG